LIFLVVFGVGLGCNNQNDTAGLEDSTEEELTASWYANCGDPVCGGYTGPFDGVALCTDENIGSICESSGQSCDPQDDCNVLYVCATEDPGINCPVSQGKHKTNITSLTTGDRQKLSNQINGIEILEWQYLWATDAPPQLGFIIDPSQPSPAVRPNGEQVDLYGYTSMLVVTVQEQAKEIKSLEARLEALESRLNPAK
jgi:hypothetical protein